VIYLNSRGKTIYNGKMKGKIVGQQRGVMVNKESVIGVATTDIVVEKKRMEMDVMDF